MREVDFRYLRSAVESLNASTDLVLARGRVQVTLSRQCSPYASHRRVIFDVLPQPLGADVLLVANYRKIMVVGLTEDAARQAAESIGRDGRPFPDSLIGWDGPWANWVCEPVPPTLPLLHGLLCLSRDYGLVGSEWLEAPLVYTAWLVPVVMEWDEFGRPIFSWPHRPSEPEPEPERVDQDLPVEV